MSSTVRHTALDEDGDLALRARKPGVVPTQPQGRLAKASRTAVAQWRQRRAIARRRAEPGSTAAQPASSSSAERPACASMLSMPHMATSRERRRPKSQAVRRGVVTSIVADAHEIRRANSAFAAAHHGVAKGTDLRVPEDVRGGRVQMGVRKQHGVSGMQPRGRVVGYEATVGHHQPQDATVERSRVSGSPAGKYADRIGRSRFPDATSSCSAADRHAFRSGRRCRERRIRGKTGKVVAVGLRR